MRIFSVGRRAEIGTADDQQFDAPVVGQGNCTGQFQKALDWNDPSAVENDEVRWCETQFRPYGRAGIACFATVKRLGLNSVQDHTDILVVAGRVVLPSLSRVIADSYNALVL